MASVDIYKSNILLGSGTLTAASTSCTSYTGTAPINMRNVQVTSAGKTINTAVLAGSGTSTLTLKDAWPF